jgi:hypothetical protein
LTTWSMLVFLTETRDARGHGVRNDVGPDVGEPASERLRRCEQHARAAMRVRANAGIRLTEPWRCHRALSHEYCSTRWNQVERSRIRDGALIEVYRDRCIRCRAAPG